RIAEWKIASLDVGIKQYARREIIVDSHLPIRSRFISLKLKRPAQANARALDTVLRYPAADGKSQFVSGGIYGLGKRAVGLVGLVYVVEGSKREAVKFPAVGEPNAVFKPECANVYL